MVESLEYDAARKRVSAVRIVDTQTGERSRLSAKLIFLCASTIGSTQILLQSTGGENGRSFANASDALGRYMMDHTYRAGARGIIPGFEEYYPYGYRPNGIYIPRFRNVQGDDGLGFTRGYGYQGGANRIGWHELVGRTPGLVLTLRIVCAPLVRGVCPSAVLAKSFPMRTTLCACITVKKTASAIPK